MEKKTFLEELRRLSGLVDQASDIEKAVNDMLSNSTNHNVLDCPERSRKRVQDIRDEMKRLSEDSSHVYSSLVSMGSRTDKLMSNASVVLSYFQKEITNLEDSLKDSGFVSHLERKRKEEHEIKKVLPAEKAEIPPQTKDNPKKSEVATAELLDDNKSEMSTSDSHQLPPSPKLEDFNLNYDSHAFRKTSLVTPELPSASMAGPEKRYFASPNFEGDASPRKVDHDAKVNLPKIHFPPITMSPQTPVLKQSSNQFFNTNGNTDFFNNVQDSPDGIVIHTRRSVLRELPEETDSIDDDTMYLLQSRPTGINMVTPETPELSNFCRVPKLQGKETKKFLEMEPGTPQTPELTVSLQFSQRQDAKENLHPSDDAVQLFKIRSAQYDLLPDYLKRLFSIEQARECFRKVLLNTSSLPGEKYSHVITQHKIEEVTKLAGKTRSLIYLFISLKLIRIINGTEYFEVLQV